MSAEQCGAYGEHFMNMGRWQEAERLLLAAVDKAEGEKDLGQQAQECTALGTLCRQRGDFPQAMVLVQQALGLAERLCDKGLIGLIHDQIGSTHLMQG